MNMDIGSKNDVTRPVPEPLDFVPTPQEGTDRASGTFSSEPLNTYPEILREALAVTVARLPFSSPETWQLWQDVVMSAFLLNPPPDPEEA